VSCQAQAVSDAIAVVTVVMHTRQSDTELKSSRLQSASTLGANDEGFAGGKIYTGQPFLITRDASVVDPCALWVPW
jgi:hypothetical protein